MENLIAKPENMLESLTEAQRDTLYAGYRMLVDEHNLNARRIMRILKLKEYELKMLVAKAEEK